MGAGAPTVFNLRRELDSSELLQRARRASTDQYVFDHVRVTEVLPEYFVVAIFSGGHEFQLYVPWTIRAFQEIEDSDSDVPYVHCVCGCL